MKKQKIKIIKLAIVCIVLLAVILIVINYANQNTTPQKNVQISELSDLYISSHLPIDLACNNGKLCEARYNITFNCVVFYEKGANGNISSIPSNEAIGNQSEFIINGEGASICK